MIGRADIEESKSNVAMNAWLPQASYPCGNFSDTSSLKFLKSKGSIGHAFAVCIHTENQNQVSFYPSILQEISVLFELTLGHLRYLLTDVPPQPNSPPDFVSRVDCRWLEKKKATPRNCSPGITSFWLPPLRPSLSEEKKKERKKVTPSNCLHTPCLPWLNRLPALWNTSPSKRRRRKSRNRRQGSRLED